MRSPYQLDRPAIISFSGGRTSGYLLWQVIQAFGGALPADVIPVFCNTGKEFPQTLDFVERCAQRWSVPIVWLEYRAGAMHRFVVVDYTTASRQGEPFSDVIRWKQVLPNPLQRFCTQWLKILPKNRYARHVLGWQEYTNAVGLRFDEPGRVMRLQRDDKSTPGEEPETPLSWARVTQAMVLAFWREQPFDLELETHESNCDFCFLKGRGKITRLMRDHPGEAEWWLAWEKEMEGKRKTQMGARFRRDRPSYASLQRQVEAQPLLPFLEEDRYPECACTD